MSAVHFVSATAPPDTSKASVAAKQLSEILARQCGSEVQRVASWQCINHGLEEAIVMTFTNTEAVRRTSLGNATPERIQV